MDRPGAGRDRPGEGARQLRLEGARRSTSTTSSPADVDPEYLRDTLQALGTPRYAFGFLSSAITEHARNLPDDLPQDDEAWRIPRSQLDIVRAAWLERANLLRRNLN